jgi:hypothetical protein
MVELATQKVAPRKSAQRKESKDQGRKSERPGLPMLRTSERTSFRRCRQRWWWGWREGLTGPFTANSLWFGEGIHVALATRYQPGKRRGPHPAKTWAEWVGEEKRRIYTQPNPDVDETVIVDALELGTAMLEHYVDHYGKDDALDFISVEQPFQIEIPAWDSTVGLPTLYCGTFDGVFRDQTDDTIWLIEHKTAKSISTLHLPLDDQAGSYWAVATTSLRRQKLIGPKESLEGIRYNYLRKAMPDQREVNANGERLNKDGSVSKQQPAAYFLREPVFRLPSEQLMQIERIKQESHEMQLVRNGVLPVTKNPTANCWWDCPFFQMCQLHEAGDDWQSFRDAMFVVEDPYWAHRNKSTAE